MFSLKALYSLAIVLLLTRAVAAPVESGKEVQGPGYLSLGFEVRRVSENGTIAKGPIKRDNIEDNIIYNKGAYFINLYAGSNKQNNTLLVDTGSSFLWFYDKSIGASEQLYNGTYDPSASSSAKILSSDFRTAYGSGASIGTGKWIEDDIRLSPNGPAFKTDFGDVDKTQYLSVGILGLGYTDPNHPNLGQSLLNSKLINKNAFSLYLDGEIGDKGNLLYGAVDHAKYTGELTAIDIENGGTQGLSVLLVGFTIKEKFYPDVIPVLVDSGSTDISLPGFLLDQLNQDIFGGKGKLDPSGQYYIDGKCPSVGDWEFEFATVNIKVPQDDYLVDYGDNACHLTVQNSGGGYSVLGQNFLRHAYTVFDLTDNTISFAPIKHTSESNIKPI